MKTIALLSSLALLANGNLNQAEEQLGQSAVLQVQQFPPLANNQSPIDLGYWSSFLFGPAHSQVPITIGFNNSRAVVVRLTDAFCKGDRFELLDHGIPVLETSLVQMVPCDKNACKNTVNPSQAFIDRSYSSGGIVLLPGLHSLTIRVLQSPFGSGQAFLRVDTLWEQCTVGPYTIVQQPSQSSSSNAYYNAEDACSLYGLRLAPVGFLQLPQVALALGKCIGKESKAWVQSKNWCSANVYNGPSCLVAALGTRLAEVQVGPLGNCFGVGYPAVCRTRLLHEEELEQEQSKGKDRCCQDCDKDHHHSSHSHSHSHPHSSTSSHTEDQTISKVAKQAQDQKAKKPRRSHNSTPRSLKKSGGPPRKLERVEQTDNRQGINKKQRDMAGLEKPDLSPDQRRKFQVKPEDYKPSSPTEGRKYQRKDPVAPGNVVYQKRENTI